MLAGIPLIRNGVGPLNYTHTRTHTWHRYRVSRIQHRSTHVPHLTHILTLRAPFLVWFLCIFFTLYVRTPLLQVHRTRTHSPISVMLIICTRIRTCGRVNIRRVFAETTHVSRWASFILYILCLFGLRACVFLYADTIIGLRRCSFKHYPYMETRTGHVKGQTESTLCWESSVNLEREKSSLSKYTYKKRNIFNT